MNMYEIRKHVLNRNLNTRGSRSESPDGQFRSRPTASAGARAPFSRPHSAHRHPIMSRRRLWRGPCVRRCSVPFRSFLLAPSQENNWMIKGATSLASEK